MVEIEAPGFRRNWPTEDTIVRIDHADQFNDLGHRHPKKLRTLSRKFAGSLYSSYTRSNTRKT